MTSTNHFGEVFRMYLDSMKKNQKMSTCNQLDLETLGSQLIFFQKYPWTLVEFIVKYEDEPGSKSPDDSLFECICKLLENFFQF
jgi:hypothetical protein